jgi:hypothetical protein
MSLPPTTLTEGLPTVDPADVVEKILLTSTPTLPAPTRARLARFLRVFLATPGTALRREDFIHTLVEPDEGKIASSALSMRLAGILDQANALGGGGSPLLVKDGVKRGTTYRLDPVAAQRLFGDLPVANAIGEGVGETRERFQAASDSPSTPPKRRTRREPGAERRVEGVETWASIFGDDRTVERDENRGRSRRWGNRGRPEAEKGRDALFSTELRLCRPYSPEDPEVIVEEIPRFKIDLSHASGYPGFKNACLVVVEDNGGEKVTVAECSPRRPQTPSPRRISLPRAALVEWENTRSDS